jgi:hypothetical protein
MADDPQSDDRKARYDSYVREREGLRESSLEISGRYDKSILFLSGGSLALSLTFIEKIAPHPSPWSFALLAIAWLLLIASLVLELYALATSQTAINEQILLLDAEYDAYVAGTESKAIETTTGPAATPDNRFTVRTRRLNVWSLRCLVVGLAFLCAFSGFNLPIQ